MARIRYVYNYAFIATGRDCTKTRRWDAFFFPKRKEAAIKTTFIFTRYIQERSRFFWLLELASIPPISLHFIFAILLFEISSLMMNWIFSLHISNLNFTGFSRQKNPVQTRKKFSSSKSKFQTGELQKSSADR